jgi:glycosyltransferase involved in cell wall biosynthesis
MRAEGQSDANPDGKAAKVLFVATVFAHLTAFHVPFMQLLRSWGYEVHAAASCAEGDKNVLSEAGVICWDIHFARSATSLQNWRAYWELKALLKQHRYALIHVHTPMAAWLGRLAAKRTAQGPVLYTAHGFHFYKGAPWRYWLFYYPAERLAARWTDGLILINDEDFTRAQRMRFKPGQDLFLVHGVGVDTVRFGTPAGESESLRQELGLNKDDLIVTCVAEFTPTKNHAALLAAWRRVSEVEHRAHLLLAGIGEKHVAMKNRVQREGLPRVHFLGFRSDVPRILRETDTLVLASQREGLPCSVMEAMAAGIPIVGTNVRGIRDLLESGVTGLLVEPNDIPGLARALLALIRDPEMRTQMGAAAREKIQEYSLEQVLGQMKAVYRRYLKI